MLLWAFLSLQSRSICARANLSAGRLRHHLRQLFGDVGLIPFRVALALAHDVGNEAIVAAAAVFHHHGLAAARQAAPHIAAELLTTGVVDVTGLGVGDLVCLLARAAAIFFRPARCDGARLRGRL